MTAKKKSNKQKEELLNAFDQMDPSHRQAFMFGVIYNLLDVGNNISDYMNGLIKHADELLEKVKGR